ncbi:alkaline phosphatase D family protein [Aurantiacibacter flavus]|uniref:Alkaline phosphatase D family protein n=1 Tax=Aurantiacibacter flavus TaxID=3145232 RepID=A0ABV0CVS7_9SPHN
MNTPFPLPSIQGISRRSLLRASALGPALLVPHGLQAAEASGFTHSVASGDPEQRSVTLWTRYVAPHREATWLTVEIAADENFAQIVGREAVLSTPDADYCCHARPDDLAPGRWYFYRFLAPNGDMSPVGRTRTLPTGNLDEFKIAVFSCSNATSGWFNAYAHAAERDDLDLLIHLGDYIYESRLTRSDAVEGMAEARGIEPPHETVSLQDYRQRYASYRQDRALQELHRRYPIIVMWDDHETVNNSWIDGADNHDEATEGPWRTRMAAGVQAFHEWLPMRPSPYTRYDIGDLATLFRLETRLVGRSQQLRLHEWMKQHGGSFDEAAIAFRDGPLADQSRSMLGAEQEQWLANGLAASVAEGKPWQIVAQQVIMGQMMTPQDYSSWFTADNAPDADDLAEMAFGARLAQHQIPSSMDKWDGYPAARARLYDAAEAAGADMVVLAGDSHNAWAFELDHEGRPVGVEFAVPGVSSLGIDKRVRGDPSDIAASFVAACDELAWCDTSQRGYMVLDVTPDRVVNEWLFVPARFERSREVAGTHRLAVARGTHRLSPA